MHIKFQERRAAVLLQKCTDIDEELKDISASIAQNVRILGAITLGETEASIIERRIKLEVDKVMSVPTASVPGIAMRRDLLRRLNIINKYLDHTLTIEDTNCFRRNACK